MSDHDHTPDAGRVLDYVAAHPGATLGDLVAALGLRRGEAILVTLDLDDLDCEFDAAGHKHFTIAAR